MSELARRYEPHSFSSSSAKVGGLAFRIRCICEVEADTIAYLAHPVGQYEVSGLDECRARGISMLERLRGLFRMSVGSADYHLARHAHDARQGGEGFESQLSIRIELARNVVYVGNGGVDFGEHWAYRPHLPTKPTSHSRSLPRGSFRVLGGKFPPTSAILYEIPVRDARIDGFQMACLKGEARSENILPRRGGQIAIHRMRPKGAPVMATLHTGLVGISQSHLSLRGRKFLKWVFLPSLRSPTFRA